MTTAQAVQPTEAFYRATGAFIAKAVEDAVAPLLRRIAELEAREPLRGEKGDPGRDGKDGIDGNPGETGASGRDGIDGKDGNPGRDGERGEKGADGAPGRDGRDGAAGRDGKDGKDGEPGADGKDGTPGLNGKDGRDGIDGKDASLSDYLAPDEVSDAIAKSIAMVAESPALVQRQIEAAKPQRVEPIVVNFTQPTAVPVTPEKSEPKTKRKIIKQHRRENGDLVLELVEDAAE